MAIKVKNKEVEPSAQPAPEVTATMTAVNFRTKLLLKKKAEEIFDDMGISMSAALNLFLAQVVRERGMPFLPTTKRKKDERGTGQASGSAILGELEDIWEL